MQAFAYLHHPVVRFDEATPSHLIVTVKGDEGEKARPPLNLVIALDKSGSMNNERKLSTVVSALNHLTGYLSPKDHLALVTFDAVARVVVEDVRGDERYIVAINTHLGSIRGTRGTNLDQGLVTAISLANTMARKRPNSVTRIILLTDGEISEGEARPDTVLARLNIAGAGIGLTTIGVGTNCDHDLLGRLAIKGHGSYGFVETPDQAAEVLGVEIGGLVNLDAGAVVVRVQGRAAYLSMAAPLGAESKKDGDEWVVDLGTLIAGQVRSLVFPVTTKALVRANARAVSVSDVAVSGRGSEGELLIELRPKLQCVKVAGERDVRGDEIVDRAVLAEAQRRAEKLARSGDFSGASQSFSGLGLSSPGYELLAGSVSIGYAEGTAYNYSAVMRSSAAAMLSASSTLIGSSETFNSVTSRMVGNYGVEAAREVGAATSLSVADSLSVGVIGDSAGTAATPSVVYAGATTTGASLLTESVASGINERGSALSSVARGLGGLDSCVEDATSGLVIAQDITPGEPITSRDDES